MKKDNPFTLTFGKQPIEYISRYESTDRVISTFTAEHPVSQAYLIEGIRGSGKTVLMTTIANELKEKSDWVVVDLNATQDLVEDLCMRLADPCKKAPELVEAGINISFGGYGVGFNGSTQPRDDVSTIEELLRVLHKKQKRVLITIDEVMQGHNMRHFASQFQIWVRKDYPIFLLMTGLYENIYAIQNDPALTFLLRTPKIHLEPLSMYQIAKQYRSIFQIGAAEARELADITKGYAFAFQALGMLYYEYRETEDLKDILEKLDDMLDDFVYKKIWETLSAQDRQIVQTMPEGEIKVGELCGKLSMTSSVFSKYRERLLKKGIICATKHGFVALALPRFSGIVQNYG